MQEDNTEYPPGYLEADEKYNLYNDDHDGPLPGSVAEIWECLDEWREFEKGYPKPLAHGIDQNSEAFQNALKHGAELIGKFKARILKAAFDGDRLYLENLLKAINHDGRPQLEMNGIRAAIQAFWDLFIALGYQSKDDWPTKQEIRRRAGEILRASGRALPGDRQWPRIFKQAGLFELPSVTFGRARKRKKN